MRPKTTFDPYHSAHIQSRDSKHVRVEAAT